MSLKKIEAYVTDSGECPFDNWLEKLPIRLQGIVLAYIKRVAAGGSKKNVRALKDGVAEININIAGGLRIYFGVDEGTVVLLLIDGNKSSQKRDIQFAKKYWRDYAQSK